ncbi:hypothetical protein LZT28_22520 [Aeromonas media]|uniref:Uncharacterized protein n=1 Tax=Aeromonas media TaxID=651 RepID=A0AAW5RWE2_AERME|nr:hypothetical protein [Aeromonas media]MCV3290954.1 hypothetical protein [Aeromonas media]
MLATRYVVDWQLGPWLSSWEANVVPGLPRYFNASDVDGSTWLLTDEPPTPEMDEDDSWDYDDNAADIAKHLVVCWPNPPVEVAKSASMTLPTLRWFMAGKTSLERAQRVSLETLLGIKYDVCTFSYVGSGPYVLMAHKPQALQTVYESISGGGDASPCEIVPREGVADPGWRYILINPYGSPPSIVMVPRGAKIMQRLPDVLLNYAGINTVSLEFFREVVATCAKACRDPASNLREMNHFVARYKTHWENSIWQPE